MLGLRTPLLLIGCALVSACSSTSGRDVSANASCDELNAAIGQTSTEISSTAINRGAVDDVNVPRWLPAGARAKEALVARNTRQIDNARVRQEMAISQYRSRCGG